MFDVMYFVKNEVNELTAVQGGICVKIEFGAYVTCGYIYTGIIDEF